MLSCDNCQKQYSSSTLLAIIDGEKIPDRQIKESTPREKRVKQNQDNDNSNNIKAAKIVCIVLVALVIVAVILGVVLSKKGNDNSLTTITTTTQKVDNIQWTVKYKKETNEIISISARTVEADQKSQYYQTIAYRHGDHALVVEHITEYTGTPIGDNWYKIEMNETYSFAGEVLHQSASRIEKKLEFNLPES